ncbi:DUF58 domain-containing protein [Microbacterium sp.]|uniref:DUF58 domain-containing protein n=1 Tax=Microbacterium sp. TaxID=51671 RepID=UPI00260ECE47|nr:DUF58 domain-containing protein [Microbacterium sp.]
MRRRRSLTFRGAGALLAGVACVIAANVLAAPILLYVAMLLFALVILAALAVHVPRRSGSVTRRISTDLLTVGERSQVEVRFDLRALRVPHGIWTDQLPPAVSGEAAGEFPSDDGTRLSYSITGIRRGIWSIGPLTLRTIDPFGLAQREQLFGEPRTITIVPEVVPLAPLASTVGAAGGTAHASSSRLGQGSDNLSPRHYVSGDSMRRIHWRATAHRGDLMVRQEEEEASPDALVILDRTARRWSTAADDPAFETAVSACASIALHLLHEGYSVDVLDSAGTVIGALRGHEDDRDDLLVALSHVTPHGEAHEIVTLFDGTPPGPLVLITGRLDDTDAATMRHGGAAAPIMLVTDPTAEAGDVLAEQGWSAATLADDVADAWADALPPRLTGGDHGVR